MRVCQEDPISLWLNDLQNGDSLAQHNVVRKFAKRVEGIANRCLAGVPLGDSDGEDVAINVLNSLFRRVEDGRIVPPVNRRELGNLLLGMARNKSAEMRRRKLADKRGSGKVLNDPGYAQRVADRQQASFGAASVAEMLESVKDGKLRRVALLRMAGYSNDEIAVSFGCAKRTVERCVEELRRHLTNIS